jgi:cytoskeletal protein CcmA (bactofilin family)
MAQIIKHRRGSISSLASVTANVGELVMATGSIGDLTAPVIFIGDSAVAGGYKPVSKIYQGTSAPDLTSNNWGTTMNGTPFYASGNKSLNILNNAGNTKMDLTGNIEGNTISGVTITSLSSTNITGSNGNFTSLTGLTFTSTNGNITSLSGSNANITNITGTTITGSNARVTGDLNVEGAVYVTGDISGSDLNLTGNATIDGDIVLKGNINIGNQTTDLITFGGEVSSSILPQTHNAFDLGSSDLNWRNIHVSGTAYIETLNLGTITLNSLALPGDLTVSGTTILSGSIYNDELTEKRLVVVGADGLLTDYSGLTFDNGNLNLSGALEITNIQGTGSLYLKPDLNDSRLFEIYNSAGPSGYTDIHLVGNADLNFFGDDTNYLKIDDYAQTATLVGVNGVIVSSSLQVTGSVFTDKILGTGSLYLQPDQIDGRYFEIYNTGASDTHIKSSGGLSFFGDDTNYLKIDDSLQTATIVGVNGVFVSSSLTVTGSFNLKDSATNFSIVGNGFSQTYFQGNGALVWNPGYGGMEVVGTDAHLKVNDYLLVGNGAGITGSLGVSGSATFLSGVTVQGVTSLTNTLNVTGTTTINGDETVNGILTVTGETRLGGNLFVSGNLEVLGSATNVNLQSSTVEIGDNIVLVNAYSPFEKYAGLAAYDSGSSGTSGSVLWDSLNDYWLIQKSDGNSSKVVGTTTGSMGSEISLTTNNFPKATSANTIGDSLLADDATTLTYNTNKFTVASNDGATLIAGNVTLSSGGAADATNKTSAIVFKNSSNVLGYVSTTETTDVLDGILGYKNSNGGLVFSTVIDGGTY